MSRFAVPSEITRAVDALSGDIGHVRTAVGTISATPEGVRSALATAKRMRASLPALRTALDRFLSDCERAENAYAREARKAEERNERIRRERGLPTGSSDLAIPQVTG